MRSNSRKIALCGVLAALAVVIMCLGGLVPLATYVCPMLCTIVQFLVLKFCGNKQAWTWYVAVSILSLLMGPDKEAVMVWISIGCYPMLKPIFEKKLLGVLLKLAFFNVTILLAYGILVYLMGLQEVAAESMEFGLIGLAIILILGNGAFLLLDRLLTIMNMRFRS